MGCMVLVKQLAWKYAYFKNSYGRQRWGKIWRCSSDFCSSSRDGFRSSALLYVNDIGEGTSCTTRLFADDALIYKRYSPRLTRICCRQIWTPWLTGASLADVLQSKKCSLYVSPRKGRSSNTPTIWWGQTMTKQIIVHTLEWRSPPTLNGSTTSSQLPVKPRNHSTSFNGTCTTVLLKSENRRTFHW